MQRLISSARAPYDHVIDITPTHTSSSSSSLHNRKSFCRRFIRSSRLKSYCHVIHAVPFVLLFCLFVLWLFSYPVDLEMRDGRVIAARKVKFPAHHHDQEFENETRLDYTILMKKPAESDQLVLLLAPPPEPRLLPDATLANATSSVPQSTAPANDTSAVPQVLPL